MARRQYSDEARGDPDKLIEVQQDLLEAAAIGEIMIGLAEQLSDQADGLRSGMVPGQDPAIDRIKAQIYGLNESLRSTFGNMAEGAVNLTYLGNLAGNRYGQTIPE